MNLDELKNRLDIKDSSQDEMLQVDLDDAISYAKEFCNNDFKNGFPPSAKRGIAELVKYMQEDNSVSSRSLNGDLTESYFQDAKLKIAERYFKRFKKARFR